MPFLTPDQIESLADTLRDFDEGSMLRGQNYLRSGRVDRITWSEENGGFEAQVRGSSIYAAKWWPDDEGWDNSCTCPLGGWCKHTYALGAKVVSGGLATGSEPPDASKISASVEEFEAELVRAHGRPLKSVEKRAVKKLEQLFTRVMRSGVVDPYAITDFAHTADPGLLFTGHVSLGLLTEVFDRNHPPATVREFWQHLAVLFRARHWALPEVFAPITDTTEIEARIAARRRKQELAEWTQRLEALGGSQNVPPPVSRRRLRVMIGPKALVFQAAEGDGAFASLALDHQREMSLGADFARAAELWDTPSLLLLGLFQQAQPYGWNKQLNLRDPQACHALARALAQPELRERVVDAEGRSLTRAETPLAWHFTPDPGDDKKVVVELRLADGEPAPASLRYLGGPPHVYLSTTTVYAGPPPLHGRADAGWKASIPAEVVAQERVVRALMRAGARLPPAIEERVTHVALRPLVRAELGITDFGLECVRVSLAAIDAAGQRHLIYRAGGWSDKLHGAPPRPTDGRVIVHDMAAVARAERQFQQLHFDWNAKDDTWRRTVTANTPEEISAWLAAFSADTIFELAPELASLRDVPMRAAFALEIEASGRDWFDVELVVRAEDTKLSSAEVNLLLQARGRWVRLEGKGWRRLELAADEKQTARLNELGLSAAGALQGRQRFHALQLAAAELEEITASRAWQAVQERARAIQALPPPPAPAGLVGELRPYQREGFHFLAHLSANSLGGILADDMGLGKTVQALAWLLWLAEQEQRAPAPATDMPLRALVVCPKSVVTNWERETARFAPSLRVEIFRPKIHSALPAGNLVVANYAQLRSAESLFLAERWTAVILDEAQNIKNPQSQTAGVARKLHAEHRLILTGTPIENRVLDLWSLFAFAMPGLLGAQTQFKKLYDDRKDPTARMRLARRVRHFLLRRTKGQVATDLPPRIEEDLLCELDGEQQRLYQAELKRARQLVLGLASERELDAKRFNVLQSLLRLRQICCHPGLLGDDFSTAPSAKVGALFEQLEPILAEGHKVLVFSQFVTMLEILRREFETRGIAHLMLTGQTENRQELVDRFQNTPNIPVFLLSLKAAGAGLNLTAASYVVLFDPWWNPAVEAQAIDRTHRIGQVNQVIAYRLIAKDTVEEKIRRLQAEKAALARAIVQEESLASVMNLEALRFVLG